MREATKSFASKSQPDTTRDIAEKNREKKKTPKRLI